MPKSDLARPEFFELVIDAMGCQRNLARKSFTRMPITFSHYSRPSYRLNQVNNLGSPESRRSGFRCHRGSFRVSQ